MRVDDVELVSTKLPQHPVEGRESERVPLSPGGFDCPESVSVGVRLVGFWKPSCEEVNGMTLVSQLADEGVNGDADAI